MYFFIIILIVALIAAIYGCFRYRLMINILVRWMVDNNYATPDKPYIKQTAEKILKMKGRGK